MRSMLSTAESGSDTASEQQGSIARGEAWTLAASLAVLVCLNVPSLGSDPWPFRTGPLAPHGILGPLVRAADRHWDVGAMRSAAAVAGLVVLLLAGLLVSRGRVRRSVAVAATAVTLCLLIFPSGSCRPACATPVRRGSTTTTHLPDRAGGRAHPQRRQPLWL